MQSSSKNTFRFLTEIRKPIYRTLKLKTIGDFSIGEYVYERPRYRQNHNEKTFIQNGCNKGQILSFVLNRLTNKIYIKVSCVPWYGYKNIFYNTMLFPIEYATKNINDLNIVLDDHNCFQNN